MIPQSIQKILFIIMISQIYFFKYNSTDNFFYRLTVESDFESRHDKDTDSMFDYVRWEEWKRTTNQMNLTGTKYRTSCEIKIRKLYGI